MKSTFSGRIENCFDSHLHWLATGQFAKRVPLHHLRNPQKDLPALKIAQEQRDRHWLIGYGWDHNLFIDSTIDASLNNIAAKKFPTHEILDELYPDQPVYFIRTDGHAAWVNRRALELAGMWMKNAQFSGGGGAIHLKADGYPSGIVLDQAMLPFERLLPAPTVSEARADLVEAQNIFLRAGFTHIRDMSWDDTQWQAATDLVEKNELSLCVEQNVSADDPATFYDRLKTAVQLRREMPSDSLIRIAALKIYLDGALGSEGALLSQPYLTTQQKGLQLLPQETLREYIYQAWSLKMPIAIHTIGDAAAHLAVSTAFEIATLQGPGLKAQSGQLNLEHAELLRPDTIQLMKRLAHEHKTEIICHLQPCHYLSDRRWLKEKLGPLSDHAFRWADLEAEKIKICFGSDSPIEPASLQNNIAGLQLAADDGIHSTRAQVTELQSHSDKNWPGQTYSEFVDGVARAVFFKGRQVLK